MISGGGYAGYAGLYIEASACSKQIEIESKFQNNAKVSIKHAKGNVKANLEIMFQLLTEKGIVSHALVFINKEIKLRLVLEEDDLIPYSHEFETKEPRISEKRYYLVKSKCLGLIEGMIFCIFEDPKCQNICIIYSKDLNEPIMVNTRINDDINKDDLNFKRIDEIIAKHLYPIQPIINRKHLDLSLIDSLNKGSFVFVSDLKYSFHGQIHKKMEIGGFFFYLLHVCEHICLILICF